MATRTAPYAAQTLALRHPDRVRLAGARTVAYPLDYDVLGARDALAILRFALRSTWRAVADPVPWGRRRWRWPALRALALRLRARIPLEGPGSRRTPAGPTSCACVFDDRGLAGVLSEADSDLAIYRDFPAAAVAYEHGEPGSARANWPREALHGWRQPAPAIYYSAGLDAAGGVP